MIDQGKHPHVSYRPDIDGLRAIAVLSVVICHAFPKTLSGGFVGVDIFFVISGFLITSILVMGLEEARFSIADFYARRVRRLFPVLAIMLGVTLILGAMFQLPNDYMHLGIQTLGGVGFVANIVEWQSSGYFSALTESKPLLHLWSLGIEEQFYLAWPLLLWLSWRLRLKPGVFLSTIAAASLAYSLYKVSYDSIGAFYSPISRFWELAVGGLLGVAMLHRPWHRATKLQDAMGIAGLVLAIMSFVLIKPGKNFPGILAMAPVASALLIIGAGSHAITNRHVLSNRVMVWFGLISYPLYLWHWPILVFVWNGTLGASPMAIRNATLLAVIVSIALAWASYRFVEMPLKSQKSKRWVVPGLASAMGGVAVAAAIIVAGKGLPDRMPSDVRELANAELRDAAWIKDMRNGVCHNMVYNGTNLGTQADCFQPIHPTVLLWGDSHAAALYAGLKNLQSTRNFGIWQITTDASSPFFDKSMINNMHWSMDYVNNIILDRIRVAEPDVILLHAYWRGYDKTPTEVVDELRKTITLIRANAPHSRIVVLGPVPTWKRSLQETLVNYAIRRHTTMPERFMNYGLETDTPAYDKAMANALPSLGVTYVSAEKALCDPMGCLARLDNTPAGVAYVDATHLSIAGSDYLAKKIGDELLGQYATSASSSAHAVK